MKNKNIGDKIKDISYMYVITQCMLVLLFILYVGIVSVLNGDSWGYFILVVGTLWIIFYSYFKSVLLIGFGNLVSNIYLLHKQFYINDSSDD